MNARLFQSFFVGGFECSTHRLATGKRLDLCRATRHDEFAASDYRLLQQHGIRTAREGLRWHLIEAAPGRFDFSSARPMIDAARESGMQIIWDLWHYGWPDDLDIFSADFVRRFTAFARAAAELLSESFTPPLISPINEISFFSWAGGDGGIFNPFAKKRGNELKRQLVRATLEATVAMREVNPAVRLFQVDPMINVIAKEGRPQDKAKAEAYRQSQFEVWDMLSGRARKELGGQEDFLDVIGVNYYIHNQWTYPGGHGSLIVPSDPRYRHVRAMLQELHARYGRPIFVAETGIEDETRPAWLRYMCNEVCAAMDAGVPVEGICLYPILNHPGWDDDRHCYNGLFDYAGDEGRREVYQPLADELSRQQKIVDPLLCGTAPFKEDFDLSTSTLDWAAHVMEERTDEARSARKPPVSA
ncbi:MAG: beta-glucosidase [Verrucomicrobiota bacterium]|nr:beta-glucosidase [Verrucomicrobiota bacterium]